MNPKYNEKFARLLREVEALKESAEPVIVRTITIQIGNSDNKLTQVEWARFVEEINMIILQHRDQQHFFGGSINWMPWQNVCWVITCAEWNIDELKAALVRIRAKYSQESVAYMEGEPQFL